MGKREFEIMEMKPLLIILTVLILSNSYIAYKSLCKGNELLEFIKSEKEEAALVKKKADDLVREACRKEQRRLMIDEMNKVWRRIDGLDYTRSDLYMADTLFQNKPKDVINEVLYAWNKEVKRDTINPSVFVRQRIALLKELLEGVQADPGRRISLHRLHEMVHEYKSYISREQLRVIHTIGMNSRTWHIFARIPKQFRTLREVERYVEHYK